MQYCVYITTRQYGCVHVEAENEREAKQKAETLFSQHRVPWQDEEITDIFSEEVYP